MDNKEKYAGLISRSPLFSLDKEKDANAYAREAFKMVEYLYCYLMTTNRERYEEYALEITQTANRCINNYRPECGDFLVYFLSAMKLEYRRAYAKDAARQMRGGMHVADEDERNLQKLCRYMQSKGIEQPDAKQLQVMTAVLGMSEERISDLLALKRETVVVSEYTSNDDGEEISLFDTIASDDGIDTVDDMDAANELLLRIDAQYRQLQERSKPVVAAILTLRVCKVIANCGLNVQEYSFIDGDIIKEYIMTGNLPTQREIADKLGKNEASISRTVNEFLKKANTIECGR